MSACFAALEGTQLIRLSQFQVKSTKMGTGRKFVILQHLMLEKT